MTDRKSVRQIATEILLRVDTDNAYADRLLDHALKLAPLNQPDRALLTELVYGTLRWRGRLDAALVPLLRRPLADTEPFVLNLLRVTLYQLMFLDKIPAYAAVNEAVDIAGNYRKNLTGFVNGVLRSFLRQHQQSPGTSAAPSKSLNGESHQPAWLVQRWRRYFGTDDADALLLACNQRAPLVLRVNRLKTTRAALLAKLSGAKIDAKPTLSSPWGVQVSSGTAVEELPGFAEGWFQVQGEASQLVAFLLAPQPSERILDACAAPGGKATLIAELMDDQGEIIAIDSSERGIQRIGENIRRLGLTSIRAFCADICGSLPLDLTAPYDRVLVDAPCSGLGTLRSHPEIKWQRSDADITRLAALQERILDQVAPRVKPGGVLVYSTCTLTEEENERTVEAFLRRHREFVLQDAARYLPEPARRMVRGKYFQALPQRDNTDGFFAARTRKAS